MAGSEWALFGFVLLIMFVGVMGTVVPVLPGVPLIWIAMLVFAVVEGFARVDATFLVLCLAVVIAAEVADHLARAWGARRFGAGRAGVWGAVIGAILGLFFMPIGLILGPFLGALTGELLAGRTLEESIRAGWGGVVGTLGSMVMKFFVAVGMVMAFLIKVF